ncbi:MAG: aldo/keto reductase [Firmicutes bacterium]|nr:aldo/keto reductase [Bacillota bacterium]
MRYRKDRYGKDISVLGYGCMRFSRKLAAVDVDKTEKEIMRAIELGINYFDTAYIYPGSEDALGRILEKNNARDKVRIATKLPHYLLKKPSDMDRYFGEELSRLRTDHVDFYLMHMLTDLETWERLRAMGIEEWLEKKKAEGAIGQVGFSYHGNSDMFMKLIDARDWDFCQIQYNYFDEHSQAGRTGLEYAGSKGIPVIIMEPLRGGKLVKLPPKAGEMLKKYDKDMTPAALSFRWLWNQPQVTCVLSGMNSLEMLEENVKTAENAEAGMVSEEELALIAEIASDIRRNMLVPCTGCRYCMPCPAGVDIPGSFAAYNNLPIEGKLWSFKDYFMCTGIRKNSSAASLCIKCGKCESHCPQGIKVRDELAKVAKQFEGPFYSIGRTVMTKIARY